MCLGNTKPSAFNLLAKYPTHHGWLPESLCPKDGKTSRAASLHLPYGVFHSRLPLILKGERAGREYRVSRPNRIRPSTLCALQQTGSQRPVDSNNPAEIRLLECTITAATIHPQTSTNQQCILVPLSSYPNTTHPGYTRHPQRSLLV
ncbi:uncharacterized protein L203_105310 [Cryptococcus depauperatus CBS 7841]|uniref:Uncharacterized protein n=1 Tax=Cryptococcus depauperatus CBS 7841 TaxID=1295531 RepID=A0AAJ8M2Z6_9TREE